MNTFAERLKYAMEQADLKQSALSEQAGISKAAISQYLSGKNTPNQERIKALADVTGVTFDFLMGYGAAPVTDAPPPVKKISVKEAARCMGKSDQFVRIGLQRGLLPFGNAVPGTGNNWNYYGNTGDTAGNTAAMSDALDIAEEDLAYMRDIAEREAINRFTTAEIKVEQHNENHISKDADLDGIMDAWANDFAEKLEVSEEGVHK